MKIDVNGQLVEFTVTHISYDEIVTLAVLNGTPSVVYCSRRDGDIRQTGTMHPGCSPVLVTDMMTFSVMHIGNA